MKKLSALLFFFLVLFSLAGCRREYKSDNQNKESDIDISIEALDLFTPELESINFYLENSASMDGYGNGNTDFKRTITTLLSDLELTVDKDSVKINTVNNSELVQNKSVSEFSRQLQTQGIPKVGDRSNSDINQIFESILDKTGFNQVSILVTDAIYSVDQKGCEELIGLLEVESNETRNTFYRQLQNSELSTLILKMTSDFDGIYYPAQGGRESITQKRPYYLWFFGNSYLLKKLYNDLELTTFPGYSNDLFILKSDISMLSIRFWNMVKVL
jgi:hypothetical protein